MCIQQVFFLCVATWINHISIVMQGVVKILLVLRTTGDIVCKTYWVNKDGCEGITLDVDSMNGVDAGSETITWNLGSADPYTYLIYVNDYSQLGFDGSEGRISFYGETIVKMEVENENNEDRWL